MGPDTRNSVIINILMALPFEVLPRRRIPLKSIESKTPLQTHFPFVFLPNSSISKHQNGLKHEHMLWSTVCLNTNMSFRIQMNNIIYYYMLCLNRMVNTCLAKELEEIHAFEQKTLTPEQWEKQQSQWHTVYHFSLKHVDCKTGQMHWYAAFKCSL